MKRLSVFVALALVLCFGLALGQTEVVLEEVTGLFNADTISAGLPEYQFNIRLTNLGTSTCYNIGNGFRIFSPDGATWGTTSGAWLNDLGGIFTGTSFINLFGITGSDADTVGFAGVSFGDAGFCDGWDALGMQITIGPIDPADDGKTICIDSTFYPPGGSWGWKKLTTGMVDVDPDWSGQRCWTIYNVPDLPPNMIDCPANYTFSHCEVGTIAFNAEDPDHDPPGGEILEFTLVSGPGAINANTGVWSWSGGTVPQSGFDVIQVAAKTVNSINQAFGAPCAVNIEITNTGPAFTAGCGSSETVQTGDNKLVADMDAADDCDILLYSVSDPGGAVGAFTVGSDGTIMYEPDDADALLAQPITVTVQVTDGEFTDECTISVTAIAGAPYTVDLEKVHGQIQGQFTSVDISLCGVDPNQGIGGFDFLVAYDASALSFQQAVEGGIYDDCGWEYFTYRFGPYGNCGSACPSGMLRVFGIAETNNGANHPGCQSPIPYIRADINDEGVCTTLASLIFLVSNDRTLECQYVPIRFFWLDCGDNTISNWDGSELYISAKVFDFDNANPISGPDDFPTYLGAQDACLDGSGFPDKPVPIRNIDFQNGGIDIICADSIDARGDINLNGLPYEIADAVMFTNFFIQGLSAFGTHVDGSVAASDTNADGIPLSVADLVYLIRVVVGDAQPFPKVNPEAATYVHDLESGVLSVDTDMGAAYLVVSGDVIPSLLADNMEMAYRFDGVNTNVLVYSIEAGGAFNGDFLAVHGDIVSIEMATYDGTPVAAKAVPANYSLAQNYPNPFNPTTTVSFQLKQSGDWTISVFNVTGQLVNEISGYDEAGQVDVVWDASELASGIYFYKLDVGTFSATKKAVLLK